MAEVIIGDISPKTMILPGVSLYPEIPPWKAGFQEDEMPEEDATDTRVPVPG